MERMSLQKASGWRRSRTLATSTLPLDGGETAAWNFSSHSPATLIGSMSIGGAIPRAGMGGIVGTGAGAIVVPSQRKILVSYIVILRFDPVPFWDLSILSIFKSRPQ